MIAFEQVDVVFGPNPKIVFPLLDARVSREIILEKTQHFVAVSNASFSVNRGEIFVIMGLSGSGKSSLLRCINRLNPISRGEIKVDGSSVSKCSEKRMRILKREQVSMVFQRFSLMHWRTVKQNIDLGLELKGVLPNDRRERVQKILELVKLEKWKDHYPYQLSGGMQQRVGLARALVMQTEILLMDEPFSALDPLIRAQLQNELLRLQKELKKTIVFVSHDLEEALRIGNRIAIMQDGKIVQMGTPNEIVLKPINGYVEQFVAGVRKHFQDLNNNRILNVA
jgi:glycine betaine/proline transport system ATP-binding protein